MRAIAILMLLALAGCGRKPAFANKQPFTYQSRNRQLVYLAAGIADGVDHVPYGHVAALIFMASFENHGDGKMTFYIDAINAQATQCELQVYGDIAEVEALVAALLPEHSYYGWHAIISFPSSPKEGLYYTPAEIRPISRMHFEETKNGEFVYRYEDIK